MNAAEKAAFAKRVAAEVFGPHALALLSKELPCRPGTRGHAITHADNAAGETIGKRDPGPWIDWTLIERAKRWNDRVYGRGEVKPEAAPKRRAMTDAQRACLRGGV
jgi:hypothetical protein